MANDIRLKPLEEPGQTAVRMSQAPAWQVKKPQKDALYEGQYIARVLEFLFS